jgi:hypothetical protein
MKKTTAKNKRGPRAVAVIREVTLSEALGEAFGEIECLAEEMREWEGNLQEKFSATSKYETVSETADTLENVREPDIDDKLVAKLAEMKIKITDLKPRTRGYSRSARMGQAVYIMDLCIDTLEEFAEHAPKDTGDEINSLKDEIETAKNDVEYAEFPGMYG